MIGIGPSSVNETDPSRQSQASPSGMKRKAFDDLDIEDFCNDVYPDGKKQYLTELNIEEFSNDIIQNSNLSPEAVEMGSMAKLEVLVVDEIWDNGDFDHAGLTEINSDTLNDETDMNRDHCHAQENMDINLTASHFWNDSGQTVKNNDCHIGVKTVKRTNNFVPQSAPVEDQENGNLSWLLDFKLDSFINAPEDKYKAPIIKNNKNKLSKSTNICSNAKKYVNSENSNFAKSSEQIFPSNKANNQKKPPFTYTELIEHALQEKGELTVSAIYQWISDRFPYYKSNDDRWKNSVRHNLSINPHFRKGSKAPHGAGHLWAIANQDESKTRHWLNGNNVLTTTRQILKHLSMNGEGNHEENNVQNELVTIDEVEAATASIIQSVQEDKETPLEIVNTFTLEHSAERILSGLKRDVEVQYLIPMMVSENLNAEANNDECRQNENTDQHCATKETDFLNPVSKEVVAEECGLIGEGYLVTDINPTVLGLNLTESEIVSPENLFGEELSFQFYELTSPSQLQSA